MMDDIVKHIGQFAKGHFHENEIVTCLVDGERRTLNSKLHSAGHVVDMAVQKLELNWIPGKGYHFPNGPYVEYSGNLENLDKDQLKTDLENLCNQLIREHHSTSVMFINKQNLKNFCAFIPDYLSDDKPIRFVAFGENFAVPCGGTHVKNLSEIKNIIIRKIKPEKSNIRVSYNIAK